MDRRDGSKWRSREPPKAEDWEDRRALLTQLYIVENRKLDDVVEIMRVKYGFAATSQMYKKRIALWGLYKNYKALEKARIAHVLNAYKAQGRDVPVLAIRGRPAKLDRIRRFYNHAKRSPKTFLDDPPAHRSSAIVSTGTNDNQVLLSLASDKPRSDGTSERKENVELHMTSRETPPPGLNLQLSIRSDISQIELILRQVYHYLKRHLPRERFLIPPEGDSIQAEGFFVPVCYHTGVWSAEIPMMADSDTRTHMYACTLRDMYCHGLELLKHNQHHRAWQLLHEASDMVFQVLSKPYGDLLRVLLLLLRDEAFDSFPDIRQHVLRFFASTSRIIHGTDHPLSIILLHMQGMEILSQSSIAIFELMTDVFKSYPVTNAATWRVRRGLCDLLRRQGSYEAAESVALKLLKEYQNTHSSTQKHTRVTLRHLGNIYSDWGDEPRAEQMYQATLAQGQLDLGEEFPDDCSIFAFRGLAYSYEKQGDYVRSEINRRCALEGALHEWGAGSEDAIICMLELEEIVQMQGKRLHGWEQRREMILGSDV